MIYIACGYSQRGHNSFSTHNHTDRLQTATSLEGTTKYFYFTDTADTDSAASQTGKGQLARTEYVPNTAGTSSKNFYTYQYWDDAKQLTIKTQASNESAPGWAPGASQLSYDVNGFLTDANDVAGNRTLHYTNSATGLVVRRDETSAGKTYQHFYYYAAGKRIGDVATDPNDKYRKSYAEELAIDLKNQPSTKDRFKNFAPVTSADFDQNYEPINANYPAATASSYTVRAGDTLASIAQSLWGDSSMWYMLADANALKSTDTLAAGRVLVVPNKVTNIHNNANTFRPYNAGEMIGHVDPTLPAPPPPPDGGCGGLGQILMVVVAIAVTVVTAGAAIAALGPVLGPTLGFIAGNAVGAAAGSVASQLVGMATGDVQSFSWKAVGQSALAAGITAGVGSGLGQLNAAAAAAPAGSFLNGVGAVLSNPYGMAAATAVASTGMNMVLHGDWSWRQMGASVVGSMAGVAAGQAMGMALGNAAAATDMGKFAQRMAGSMAGGWASSEVMAGHNGFTRADSSVLFASAMGNAIGQGIADGPQNSAQQSFRQSEIREQNAQAAGMQGVGPWSDANYRNGMDIESDRVSDFNAFANAFTQQYDGFDGVDVAGPGGSDIVRKVGASQALKNLTVQAYDGFTDVRAALSMGSQDPQRIAELRASGLQKLDDVRGSLQNNAELAQEVMRRGLTADSDLQTLGMLSAYGDPATVHRIAVAVSQAGGAGLATAQGIAEQLSAYDGFGAGYMSRIPGDSSVERAAPAVYLNTLLDARSHVDTSMVYLASMNDGQFARLGSYVDTVIGSGGLSSYKQNEALAVAWMSLQGSPAAMGRIGEGMSIVGLGLRNVASGLGESLGRMAIGEGIFANSAFGRMLFAASRPMYIVQPSVGASGFDLHLQFKEGWTAAQRLEAQAKIQILNDSPTVVTAVERSGTSASTRYTRSGGTVPSSSDVDHIVDLKLGGADVMSNMRPLNLSVNRSLGAQVQQNIKNLPPGTVINRVTIGDR